jgi:hypothetical protein
MSTWREKARCRKADTDRELNPDADPNLFVDTVYGERAGAREVRHSKAAEFCVRCTVRDECRAEGLANSEEGVWGQWLMPMPRLLGRGGGERGVKTLFGSYKARFTAGVTDAIGDTAGHISIRSEQSFGMSLSRLVNVRENGCGRGCGTPAAAPLTRLEQEWHVS